jgi:hypothetical protein
MDNHHRVRSAWWFPKRIRRRDWSCSDRLFIGGIETLAETRRSYFGTILARFARLCGISPYGGNAELSVAVPSLGARHFSIALCNSQQTGFSVRICFHAGSALTNPEFNRNT